MLLDQHLVFVVCLNLLQLICSIFWNRDNLINIHNPGQNISRQVIIIPSPSTKFQCWNGNSFPRTTNIEFWWREFFDFISDMCFNFCQTCLVIFAQDCLYLKRNKQGTRKVKRKKSFEQSKLYNFKKSTFEGLATYQKHLEPQLAMYIYAFS